MAPTMLTPLLIGISNWLLPLQVWLFLVRLLHEVFSPSMSPWFWKASTGLILFFYNYDKYALELPTWSVQFPFLLTNQSTARGLLWSTAWAWMSKPYFDCRISIFWVSLFVCMIYSFYLLVAAQIPFIVGQYLIFLTAASCHEVHQTMPVAN